MDERGKPGQPLDIPPGEQPFVVGNTPSGSTATTHEAI